MIAWANGRPHGDDPLQQAYFYATKSTKECALAMLELVVSACVLMLHLLFSTRRATRTPMFWLHNIALIATICFGWMSIRQLIIDLNKLKGGTEPAPFTIAYLVPQAISPWVADLTLILRVAAFFPSITTPLQKRVAVIIFPALCQTARIPLFVTQHYAGSTLPGEAWHHIAIEYALQLATGMYCAVFLMRCSWRYMRATKHRSTHDQRIQRRIRCITEAVLGSFAVPVLFHFGLLVSTVVMGSRDFDDVSVIVYSVFNILNLTFSAPLAVLATSWSTIRTTQEQRMTDGLVGSRNASTAILLEDTLTPSSEVPPSPSKDEQVIVRKWTRPHPDDVTLLDWLTGSAEERSEEIEMVRRAHTTSYDVDLEGSSEKLRDRRWIKR